MPEATFRGLGPVPGERSLRIRARSRARQGLGRRLPGVVLAALLLLLLLGGVVPAFAAVEVPINQAPPTPAPPPPPPATAPTPAPSGAAPSGAAPVSVTAPLTPGALSASATLRIGSTGQLVKDLQRALRRRGLRVSVDGAFGPATRRAVRAMQRRLHLKPTGLADGRLLRKLGLSLRSAASAPPAATAPASPSAPAKDRYLDVFPVQGAYQYSDDFGAPRHQGRHEGIDIMADRGTPVVAVVNGTIERLTRIETGLGGIWIWLRRADGTEYYYAHLTSIVDGLQPGQAVTAGQVIGAVGNTGDARYGATHLHFEIRPGGTPTNPYPHLVAVDPTARR